MKNPVFYAIKGLAALVVVAIFFNYIGIVNLPFLGGVSGVPTFKGSSYQAVFLTNGQVYFGKVQNANRNYVKVTDIYYLIQQQPLQTQQPSEKGVSPAPSAPQFTLIKLGGELHGPEDEMVIARQQIMFIEGLREDGQVVQAIRNAKSGQ